MATTALTGARIFDSTVWHDEGAVLIGDGRILGIVAPADIPAAATVDRVEGGVLVPGFIDAQVNGGGGVLLNDAPTARSMELIWQAHRRFGTCRLLPTLVPTDVGGLDGALDEGRWAGGEVHALDVGGQ